VRVASSLADARGSGDAAAIICTPTAQHVDDALIALRASCHVLIEKPLADRLDHLDDLRDAAAGGSRVVGVAHCFRFHGLLQRVRAELAAGRIGQPRSAAVWCGQHLADWRPGRDYHATYSARRDQGGGVLLDLVHELDYCDWVLGPVRALTADVRNTGTVGIDVEDVADVRMQARDDLVIECHLDYLARPATRGGRVIGDRGTLEWDLLAGTAFVSDATSKSALDVPGVAERDEMYRRELAAFADAIAGAAPFPVDLDVGERVVRIALAARESGTSGKRMTL
jgi:predicted dehydrogenase